MKNIEAAGALVLTCLLTACGVNTPEQPRTPTALHPPSPVPEHVIPPPTYTRLPDTTTPTHIPPTATVYETPKPTSTPAVLKTPQPLPAWCANRLPARKPTAEEAGKKNVNALGTSFFQYLQKSIDADQSIARQLRDVRFTWNVYPGEDMELLRTHLPEMAGRFQILTDEENEIWNHLGAIAMINERDSDIVVGEIDALADEEAVCYPEARLFFTSPVPTLRDSSPKAQRALTDTLTAREKIKGRTVIDLVTLLTYGNPSRVRTEFFIGGDDDLHMNPSGYSHVLPSIIAVINAGGK